MQAVNDFKPYTKISTQYMRPYEIGEDLEGVSVASDDIPEIGGMIAIDINNPIDTWYVSKKFFETNYVAAESIDESC